MSNQMQSLLKKFEEKSPEIVFEWHDSETEAHGWVVINSLRGGAAGGGTRMRIGLDKREVESLAKTMEIKFSVSGPAIGGAKSGINFDPADPRKNDVLKRWYKAVAPLLKSYYGTGGDLNVDEIHEVIPITEDCGVWHPQEGVFNGHFQPKESEKIKRIGQLRYGVIKVIEDSNYSPDVTKKYKVADMITGYGVSESIIHFYKLFKSQDVAGKKVIVQGWGNVGSAAAYYLAQAGAKIVGIIDRNGGLINENGFDFSDIQKLFVEKKGNTLNAPNLIPFEEINQTVWNMQADIFIPCAASRLVEKSQIERLIQNGLQVVSCGANVPFADKEIFFGPIAEYADNNIYLIPDFIANCGMARVFAFLMEIQQEITDEAIFKDTSATIKKAIKELKDQNATGANLAKTAFTIALDKLM